MHIDSEQQNMIDAARSMVPTLLSRARKAEEDRAVPQQTFDEFTDKGFSGFTSLNVSAARHGT